MPEKKSSFATINYSSDDPMIKTVDDVLEFYSDREGGFSSFGASVLKKRAAPVEGLNQVASDLSLPKSYADFVNRFSIEGVTLGFFDLCPGDSKSICNSLRVLHGEFQNPLLPNNLLNVAGFDADIVYVEKATSEHEGGTVYFVDITKAPDASVKFLANSFESFVVLASALDQIVLDEIGDPRNTIFDLASKIGNPSQAENWRHIASMVE